MRNQIVVANEICEIAHHLTTGTSIGEHCIGDPGVGFNKAADALPGIHQFLKAPCYLAVLDLYRSDLYSAIPNTRGEPGSLKIEDYNCVGSRHITRAYTGTR